MRDHQRGEIRPAHGIDAISHDLQRINIKPAIGFIQNGELWLQQSHLQDFIALLLATRKTDIDAALQHFVIHRKRLHAFPRQLQELHGIQFALTLGAANGIQRGTQESGIAHAGQFHRILKRQKHTRGSAFFRFHRQQILAVQQRSATRHLIAIAARQNIGKRGFAGPVRAHNGMHLTLRHNQINALQNGLAINLSGQSLNFQHHPTLPSSEICNNFCASTANSIGNSLSTSRQKPFTISPTASSCESPRWRQ